jgi:tight adherence protein C
MDEADHRADMIVTTLIPVTGAATLAVLIGWRFRPQAPGRTKARSARRKLWMVGLGMVVAFIISPLLGVAAGAGSAIVRRWSVARRRTRAARRVAHDFPDTIDLLVLSIRAGYLPSQAVVEIAPFLPVHLRPSFAAVSESLGDGKRFADALGQLRVRLGPIAQPLVDSLSAADRYGLPLAPVLERLSFEARQQRRRDTDAAARELPVRLAMPLVLCTLPSFVLLAIVPLLLGALLSLRT